MRSLVFAFLLRFVFVLAGGVLVVNAFFFVGQLVRVLRTPFNVLLLLSSDYCEEATDLGNCASQVLNLFILPSPCSNSPSPFAPAFVPAAIHFGRTTTGV